MSSISQAQSRQNTGAVIGGETPSATSDHHQVPPSAITSHAAPPAQRFKIEYVPLQRTVNTYGGRNLDVIETQLERMRSRRIPRGPDELGELWSQVVRLLFSALILHTGLVDIIGLALSVRSRLSIELSYALTVLTILSTTGANQPSLGFPIYKCGDLLEVVIDLLEDEAFPEGSSLDESNTEGYNRKIYTHPELIRIASEEGSSLFSSSALFRTKSKEKPKSQDPKAKPSEIILTILNILRNLSMFPDNATFMCRDTRTLDVLSRVCSIHPTLPKPASPSLTLSNLLIARNDTIQILANVSASAHLPSHTPLTTILTFHLITSYLIDPSDALSPSQHVTFPMTASTPPLPPPSIELALEAFSRLSQPDLNRKRLAELIPSAHLYTLFTCLVHMLPLAENDFTITVLAPLLNETWLAYLERIVLSIYSLAFLASPSLKTQMRKMNGFRFIVTRMIRYYLRGVKEEGGVGHQGPPVQFAERSFEKSQYGIMIRRMIEAMGMLDSGEDTFGDVAGVGGGGEEVSLRSIFGGDEGWGKKKLEGREGAGMLSGSFEDVLGLFAVEGMDRLTFDEVESLVRVPVS
jgi:SWI/SNF chromatin-remodeling complex subunit SWI1